MAFSARILGRPIHPLVAPFPLALFVAALLCDVAWVVKGVNTPYWTLAYYCIAAGIAGGLLASIPGFIDYLSITRPVVRRLGLRHLLANSAVLILFVFNFYLRRPSGLAAAGGHKALLLLLSSAGVSLLAVSAFFGSGMVYLHGAGTMPDREKTSI